MRGDKEESLTAIQQKKQMLTLFILLLSVILFIGLYLWNYKKSQPPSRKKSNTPDNLNTRLAVHEAGHAITAWWCSGVDQVKLITIEEPTGGKIYLNFNPRAKNILWCDLVITLAGIAAELSVYSKVRSKPAEKDLTIARDLARQLAGKGATSPPWSVKHSKDYSLSFGKMYHSTPSDLEQEILKEGYRHARFLLNKRSGHFDRLVSFLLLHRSVKEEQAAEILDDRGFTRVVGVFHSVFL